MSQVFIDTEKYSTKRFTRSMSENFPLFSHLPVELRSKIWKYASQEPRIVELCQMASDNSEWMNTDPFYSPTPLPAVLSTSHESRNTALKYYPLSFPNSSNPPQIRYNPSVDILYFPAWCWQYNILAFEKATSREVKDSIQRVAIETLVWSWRWNDGTLNNQISISEFKNLKEILLVYRLPDARGCGCCYEFDKPEEGVASFREQELHEDWLKDCREVFKESQKRDSSWREPEVKFVDLLRDGKLI